MRDFAEFTKRHSPEGDLRVAFVVAQDLEFGLVRMFEVFRETPNARTSVSRDKDEALGWLLGALPDT